MRAMFILIAVAVAACTSPEATRMRAGGPGADVGNRPPVVEIHEGAQPYWRTPERLQRDVGMRDLAGARHADTLTQDGAASPATSQR
jgi:hypothetical protein